MFNLFVFLNEDFRRDTYEDYSFPLQSLEDFSPTDTFDLRSLRVYAKDLGKYERIYYLYLYFLYYYLGERLTREQYIKAENELRDDARTHYHTVIGRATIYEIIATVLVFSNTVLTFLLGTITKSEDY